MGFLSNAAARSEMRVRDDALAMLADIRPEFRAGPVLLPCHIIDEVHNGFFVDTGAVSVGVFRCQLHWWGHELDDEVLSGLRSPEPAAWLTSLRQTSPVDMGSMRGGVPEFVAGLAFGLPTGSPEEPGETEPEESEFVSMMRDVDRLLTASRIPVTLYFGAEATATKPAERTAVDAEGLNVFEVFLEDGHWHIRDEDLPNGQSTGLPARGVSYLIFAIVSQIGFSWLGAVERNSPLYGELEIRDRYIVPIVALTKVIRSMADEHGDVFLSAFAGEFLTALAELVD